MNKKIMSLIISFVLLYSPCDAMIQTKKLHDVFTDPTYENAFRMLINVTRKEKFSMRKRKALQALGARIALLAIKHIENYEENLSIQPSDELSNFLKSKNITFDILKSIQEKLKQSIETAKINEVRDAYKYVLSNFIIRINRDTEQFPQFSEEIFKVQVKNYLISELRFLDGYYQQVLNALKLIGGNRAIATLPKAISLESLKEFAQR